MTEYLPDAEEALLESEEIEHSIYGASSAHRWMNCPGSVALIGKLRGGGETLREAGEAARLGTAAHTLAAACLNSGKETFEFIGQRIDNFEVDYDMARAVAVYTNYNWMREKQDVVKAFTELPLKSRDDPEAFGTTDRALFAPGEFIEVVDYKHGAGIVVEPEYPQTKYYGKLTYDNRPAWMRGKREPKFVHLTIVQPRIPHPRGPVRTYTMTPEALTNWWDGEVRPALAEARSPDATLHVGTWCRFCPARDHCPAFKNETLAFSTSSIEPSYLTNEELGDLLLRGKAIAKYIEGLATEALNRALNGVKVKNFKLVHKIANRAWTEEGKSRLLAHYGEEAYEPRKLRSPKQIEDNLPGGKAFAIEYAFKPQTGYTLAPESDKRAEVSLRTDYFGGDLSDLNLS